MKPKKPKTKHLYMTVKHEGLERILEMMKAQKREYLSGIYWLNNYLWLVANYMQVSDETLRELNQRALKNINYDLINTT